MPTEPRHEPRHPEDEHDPRYQRLVDLSGQAAQAGRLEEARELLERAYRQVTDSGDLAREDRAFCNLAAIEIELRRPFDRLIPRLREILVRNNDEESCRLAAYHLARIYDIRKEYRKSLFYSRIARERSDRLDRRDWMASSRNQIGNAFLAESRFQEAAAEFEEALEILSDLQDRHSRQDSRRDPLFSPDGAPVRHGEDDVLRALVLDNLGYTRLVQGRHREGFRAAYTALRLLRRNGARWWEALPHLTLCFAYLEIQRLRPAARHGLRGLVLAEEVGDEEAIKTGLFLMGEVYSAVGDNSSAYDYFVRLQQRFYPDQDFIPDLLLTVDVRQIVNLKG